MDKTRREMFRGTALLVGGTAIAWGLGCSSSKKKLSNGGECGEAAEDSETHIDPGQLDSYYGIWSGGQSGEIRILGIPSMRELKRIPVFNFDSATGWGRTDWSRSLLGGKLSGDTHHVHLSYTDGTYDGRFIYVNDKSSTRLARVRIAMMEVDAMVEIPNSQGTHGIFPQRHKTGLVLCNSEFRIPQPNDGRDVDDPKKYFSMHTAVDGETMEVVWQVMVDDNLDLAATDYEGRFSFATSYNSEAAVTLEGMIASDQDWLYVFDLHAIESAVREGKIQSVGGFETVIDARGKDSVYVKRVPIAKSPHGVNVSPDGKYAICSGKLSPTCTVVDISKLKDVFSGELKPAAAVVAEPEVGLGPLHTAFDGRGNAYTSIFIDSVMTKWNIDTAIKGYTKEGVDPILEKIDVHYQVGHTNASMSETKEADGKWLIALCKFSKDRFLPTGPLRSENDQLFDISGESMVHVHDGTAYPEPHDAVIVRSDIIRTSQLCDRKDPRFRMYEQWAEEDGIDLLTANKVIRKGPSQVRIWMTSMAPIFGMTEVRVNVGDTIQWVLSNRDAVEDLTHGLCVVQHDVNMCVNPQDTQSITFKADKKGVYWYYCPWFCHALHLEMRGRMIVQ
jgi:nitrous-oxide reductase